MKRAKGIFTAFPDDFKVTPRIIELANEQGWPDPRGQVDAFKDHHLAHGTLMADWEAGFRTWLRKAVVFAKERGRPVQTIQQPKPKLDEHQPTPEQLAENRRKVGGLLRGLVKDLDVRKSEKA